MRRSIVILDDEPLIVAGLSEIIDWNSVNCDVVGTAYNGIDGMSLIDTVSPDIIISDIVMPGMTGLELAKWCFQKHKKTQLILLSAYSDFEYAQKAIQYGVSDYVLKPIDPDKLMSAVKKAVNTIENLEQEQVRFSTLENAVKTAKPIVSSSLLFDVARYGVNMLQSNHSELTRDLPLDAGVAICVKLYNLPKQAGNIITPKMQKEYAAQFEADGLKLIRGSADDKMIFLCLLPKGIDFETGQKRVMKSARSAGDKITEDINSVCMSVISEPYRTLDELNKRYLQCLEMLPVSFFAEKSDAACINRTPEISSKTQNKTQNLDILLHHLANGNIELLEKEMSALCNKLKQYKEKELAMHTFRELHRQATNIASKAGMIHKPQMQSGYVQENFVFMSCNIKDYVFAICTYIQTGKNMLGKIKLLVEEYYADCNFGLSTAADKMGITSSYLSRLFKKETGKNFLDYLVDVRMQRAKYLLKTTSLCNSEIAAQIGFSSNHYFGRVFKKKCGLTPKQYRERYHLEKAEE